MREFMNVKYEEILIGGIFSVFKFEVTLEMRVRGIHSLDSHCTAAIAKIGHVQYVHTIDAHP